MGSGRRGTKESSPTSSDSGAARSLGRSETHTNVCRTVKSADRSESTDYSPQVSLRPLTVSCAAPGMRAIWKVSGAKRTAGAPQ
jgi:hypothetical protein